MQSKSLSKDSHSLSEFTRSHSYTLSLSVVHPKVQIRTHPDVHVTHTHVSLILSNHILSVCLCFFPSIRSSLGCQHHSPSLSFFLIQCCSFLFISLLLYCLQDTPLPPLSLFHPKFLAVKIDLIYLRNVRSFPWQNPWEKIKALQKVGGGVTWGVHLCEYFCFLWIR